MNSDHNHDMAPDSFVFSVHEFKDILRDKAIQIGQELRASFIKYRQAKRTMQTQGLKITSKEYYNLI